MTSTSPDVLIIKIEWQSFNIYINQFILLQTHAIVFWGHKADTDRQVQTGKEVGLGEEGMRG